MVNIFNWDLINANCVFDLSPLLLEQLNKVAKYDYKDENS